MNTTLQLKTDLDTPCLVLDLEILDQNLKKMQALTERAGKHLRPHAKTHKCSILARRQMELGAIGICAAKVSEAEALCRSGIENILITGPVVTKQKIARLVALRARMPSLMVVVDHPGPVDLLSAILGEQGLAMDVLLEWISDCIARASRRPWRSTWPIIFWSTAIFACGASRPAPSWNW